MFVWFCLFEKECQEEIWMKFWDWGPFPWHGMIHSDVTESAALLEVVNVPWGPVSDETSWCFLQMSLKNGKMCSKKSLWLDSWSFDEGFWFQKHRSTESATAWTCLQQLPATCFFAASLTELPRATCHMLGVPFLQKLLWTKLMTSIESRFMGDVLSQKASLSQISSIQKSHPDTALASFFWIKHHPGGHGPSKRLSGAWSDMHCVNAEIDCKCSAFWAVTPFSEASRVAFKAAICSVWINESC